MSGCTLYFDYGQYSLICFGKLVLHVQIRQLIWPNLMHKTDAYVVISLFSKWATLHGTECRINFLNLIFSSSSCDDVQVFVSLANTRLLPILRYNVSAWKEAHLIPVQTMWLMNPQERETAGEMF